MHAKSKTSTSIPRRLVMTITGVLASLFLLSLLQGCATRLPPITEHELVESQTETYLPIPANRLRNCPPADLFPINGEWQDLVGYAIHLLQLLDRCNGQIDDFWVWYDGQMRTLSEKNSPTARGQ